MSFFHPIKKKKRRLGLVWSSDSPHVDSPFQRNLWFCCFFMTKAPDMRRHVSQH